MPARAGDERDLDGRVEAEGPDPRWTCGAGSSRLAVGITDRDLARALRAVGILPNAGPAR